MAQSQTNKGFKLKALLHPFSKPNFDDNKTGCFHARVGLRRLTVDFDEAGGRAAALLQRQHVEERRLPRARRPENGEHMPRGDLSVGVCAAGMTFAKKKTIGF